MKMESGFILGEIVKGTVLPPIHRDNDVKIPKHVPIVNMVIDDNSNEPGQSNSDHKTYESVQIKETPKPFQSSRNSHSKL